MSAMPRVVSGLVARPEVGAILTELMRSRGIKIVGSRFKLRKRQTLLSIVLITTLSIITIASDASFAQYSRLAHSELQDVAPARARPSPAKHLDPTDSSGWVEEPPLPAAGSASAKQRPPERQILDELLESLPVLSVGQKHAATFECELNKEDSAKQLVWLRLSREPQQQQRQLSLDEISLLSLNQKLITPDKRFKVRRQSPLRWTLTLEQVAPDDGNAYYLCQAGAPSSSSQPLTSGSGAACEPGTNASSVCAIGSGSKRQGPTSRFVGGARLNVLAPPRIVELETSPSLVHAEEFEPLLLRCKVVGEPQSQLMWKREDGQPLVGQTGVASASIEQRFKHEIERRPMSQILSIDSSELLFEPYFTRNQAGAYHCIASNGVQPGVSQRINVVAIKCRSNANDLSSASEPCDKPTLHQSTELPVQPPTTPASRPRGWRTNHQQQQRPAQSSSDLKPSSSRGSRPLFGPSDKRRTRNNNTEASISADHQSQRGATATDSVGSGSWSCLISSSTYVQVLPTLLAAACIMATGCGINDLHHRHHNG